MPGELAGQNRGFPSSPWGIFTCNFPWAFKIPVWWVQSPVQHKLTMVVHAVILALLKWWQDVLKFKVILHHLSLKLV